MTPMALMRWTIAAIHLLGLGLGLGAIWSRSRALKDPSDPRNIQRALFADTLWGIAALRGTMSINVLERTREVGVMRAIGGSNRDIQSIVSIEGLVIGLISWTVAILIAIPITSVLTRGVGLAILTAPMRAAYGISGILAWLIFTLFLASRLPCAKSLPSYRERYLSIRIIKNGLTYQNATLTRVIPSNILGAPHVRGQ